MIPAYIDDTILTVGTISGSIIYRDNQPNIDATLESSICSPSAEKRSVVNQAPALGAIRDCNRAPSRTFVACGRRSLKEFWSKFSWTFFGILLSKSCNSTRQFAVTSFSRRGFYAEKGDETDSTELIKAARCWSLEKLKPNTPNLEGKFACFQLMHVTFILIKVSRQSLCIVKTK